MATARPVISQASAGLSGGQAASKQVPAPRSSRLSLPKMRAMMAVPGMEPEALEAAEASAALAEEIAQDILGGRVRVGDELQRRHKRQVRRAEEERLRQLLVVAPEIPSEEQAWSFKGLFL